MRLLLFLIANAAAQHGWLHGVRRMTWRWLRGAGICTQRSQRARTAAQQRGMYRQSVMDVNASGGVEGWTLVVARGVEGASVLKKSGSKEPVHKAASCCIIMTRDMTRSDDQILQKLGAWPLLFCPNITANRLRPLSCAVPNGTPFPQRFIISAASTLLLHPPRTLRLIPIA